MASGFFKYITYSKEEETVRCNQSVHGYVLDGRFLRASFGTTKYCHAWLRNTTSNNLASLYLHSIGAEEDSFCKDEIAAVHNRFCHPRRKLKPLPPPVKRLCSRLSLLLQADMVPIRTLNRQCSSGLQAVADV